MTGMRVLDVVKDETGRHAVVLVDDRTHRVLVIFISVSGAQVIASEVRGERPAKPMTHELTVDLVEAAEVGVNEVPAESLKEQESIFYGAIFVKSEPTQRKVDVGPSDSIAIALRTSSPIYATDEVMDRAAIRPVKKDLEGKGKLHSIKDLSGTIEAAVKAGVFPQEELGALQNSKSLLYED